MKTFLGTSTALAFCLALSGAPVLAQTAEEKSFLSLYFSEEELVVQSATRSPQALSRVAENMTVVTAAEIERMNAHTLADVLNTVPGVAVWSGLAPGQQATLNILGAGEPHVTVIMDGVVRNYLWSQFAEVGMIPVQNIEKVEIIKGPASSAWGSALGGVINIITKSGKIVDQGGVLSGSYGTKGLGDFRAEARGKQNRFGYYLSAGRLQSRDLAPNTSTAENDVYTKLSYDITDKTDIKLTLAYERTKRDDYLMASDWIGSDLSRYLHATLTLNSAINSNLDLDISAWSYDQFQDARTLTISTGARTDTKEANDGNGVRAKLVWTDDGQTIVAGIDADKKTDTIDYITGGKQSINQDAIYVNDTIRLDKLTVIPGIRLDHFKTIGEVTSPSLGLTYGLGNNTLLRAFVARGFNVPSPAAIYGTTFWLPNPDLKVETVWSYQAGIESAAMNNLWMKLSLFRSDIRDGIEWVPLPSGELQVENVNRARHEGIMVETKTAPVYNTSLSAAAEFMRTKDLNTGDSLSGYPVQVYTIGIKYDDRQSFNALLQGRHINWNMMDGGVSKYHSMLLDLILSKRIHQYKDSSLDLFMNCHNLLNTAQYPVDTQLNPARWYEAGLRYKF